MTWKNQTSNQPFLDFYESLLQNISGFSATQQNILLTFDTDKTLDHFNESVMAYQKNKNSKHYYLHSLNDIKFNANQVTDDGDFSEVKSELSLFLEAAKSGDVFIINWSQYKPKHIGYNTVVNTQERQLGDILIPSGVVVIVIMEKSKISGLREDFYSRFRVKMHIPVEMEFPNPRYNIDLPEDIDDYSYMSWENDNWESDLLMEVIPIENNKVAMGKGHLILALEFNKKGLVIINPPCDCEGLKLFIAAAMIKRSFYLNGKEISLPEDFTIKLKRNEYDWTGSYTVDKQNDANYLLCTDILTADSYNNYFNTYHFEEDGLVKKPGWLTYSEDVINVLVTGVLTEGQWAKLLHLVREKQLKIHFIFEPHLIIPAMMATKKSDVVIAALPSISAGNAAEEKTQQSEVGEANLDAAMPGVLLQVDEAVSIEIDDHASSPLVEEALNERVLDLAAPVNMDAEEILPPASASKLNIQSLEKVSFIVSKDPQVIIDELEEKSFDLIITANQDMGYEIVETLEKDKSSASALKLKYSIGSLAEYLCAGKTIVLKVYDDALSDGLALGLESVFLPNPYLIMNGLKVHFSGKLILISNNDNYFSFYQKKIKHTYTSEATSTLLEKKFNKDNIVKLLQYNNVLDNPLSYIQLKTILMRDETITLESIRPFILCENNYDDLVKRLSALEPELLPNSVVVAQSAAEEYQQRAAGIAAMAHKNQCIFLIGATGSGKSTIILETLPNHFALLGLSVKLFVGLEKVLEWTQAENDDANAKYILFVDEANLLPKGSIEIFEDIYNEKRGIIIKGKFVPLTKNHVVIFAGNNSNYVGRIVHLLNVRHGCFYEVPTLPTPLLTELYIRPYLRDSEVATKASEVFLSAYKLVNEDTTQSVLTPRNLKNMSYRLNLLLTNFTREQLTILQAIWISCYDEIRYLLSKESKKCFKDVMLKNTNLPDYKTLKAALSKFESDRVILSHYASTHLNARRLLQQHLDLREYLIKNLPTEKFSMSELFFMGMPGVGKSSMVEHYLTHLKIQFIIMRATNQDEAEKILHDAFHKGLVVIIDEMNTMQFLEYSLNAFTMGVDLEGKPPQKKGFLVIGTGNPISFGGRYALSSALDNRFLVVNLKNYQLNDLILIGAAMGLPPEFVKENAQLYLATKAYAEIHGCSPMPSARDIINFYQTAKMKIKQNVAVEKKPGRQLEKSDEQSSSKKARCVSPAAAAAVAVAHHSGFDDNRPRIAYAANLSLFAIQHNASANNPETRKDVSIGLHMVG